MDDDKDKPEKSDKLPLLTSLILKGRYDVSYEILRFVYAECSWVWSADKQDDLKNQPPDVSRSPPSLVDTCVAFFRKSQKLFEQRHVMSQLHFSTKAACLFCSNEPHDSPNNAPMASALEKPSSVEKTGISDKLVSPSKPKTVQASTSTAGTSKKAVPSYLARLMVKNDEIKCLGDKYPAILAYTHLSLAVKKEMIDGWPMAAVCSVTGRLHLKLMLTLLKCGVTPNHTDCGKPGVPLEVKTTSKHSRHGFPFMQLLLRYEGFKWVAENVDFSLSPEQLKNSGILQQFYLAQTKFQTLIWIDEHLKEKLVRNVYDLNGNAMNCTKEDYTRIIADILEVLCYMIKLSNVTISASEKDNTSVLDVIFGCADLELGNIIADTGKLSFDFDSQLQMFLRHYDTLSKIKKHQMEILLKRARFKRGTYYHCVPGVLNEGHVELAIILIQFSNCVTYCEYGISASPFISTVGASLPIFILPLFRGSFWTNYIRNWVYRIEDYDTVVHPKDLKLAVNSIEHVLDVAIRPLLEDAIKDVSPALPFIIDIAEVSQYGFLMEDLENMENDLVYFVFGNRASLQALCVRRIFRNIVNAKMLRFRSRSKPASETVGPVVFPICVNGVSPDCKEIPLRGCKDCSSIGFLCKSCLKCEWATTKNMLNAACDVAKIPRKFCTLLGMECLRYEVISRISCRARNCVAKRVLGPPMDGVNRWPIRMERQIRPSRVLHVRSSESVDYYTYSDFETDSGEFSIASSASNSSSSLSHRSTSSSHRDHE